MNGLILVCMREKMNGLILRSRGKRSRKKKIVYAKKKDGLVEFFDFFDSVKKKIPTRSLAVKRS